MRNLHLLLQTFSQARRASGTHQINGLETTHTVHGALATLQIFLSAFDDVPDPRASNTRHDLGELLVIAFVSVLCGSSSCAEMAAFGRAKEGLFKEFLKLRHAIPSHDTFSEVFRMIDPKALDAAFGISECFGPHGIEG
jgi:hypothetical protein